jgi:hypothetical protein
MFRSSVAAFYALLGELFYWCGCTLNYGRFHPFFLRRHVRSEVEKIIYGMAEILFAPKIAFRSLYRCMPEQKLNLLQLTATAVT